VMLLARRDQRLSHHEVRHLGHQLLVAGHETTTSLLGMMLFRLLQDPHAMQRLRHDPALIPAAVEESLRFDSPVNGLFRTNSAGATMHDIDIPSGSKLQVLFASANRDPARFVDPDVFDIDRPRSELGRHVAFGWGIHFCIGAPLARLEARIAFGRILARTNHIELAGQPVRNESFVLHRLSNHPVRWTVA
jgi:cytochrome P450